MGSACLNLCWSLAPHRAWPWRPSVLGKKYGKPPKFPIAKKSSSKLNWKLKIDSSPFPTLRALMPHPHRGSTRCLKAAMTLLDLGAPSKYNRPPWRPRLILGKLSSRKSPLKAASHWPAASHPNFPKFKSMRPCTKARWIPMMPRPFAPPRKTPLLL